MRAVPVFYRPEQVAPAQGSSPSAEKPVHTINSWRRLGLPIDIRSFKPVSREDLYKIHDPKHVDGVLDVRKVNGFGTRNRAVANALPYTSGSFVAAALHARETGLVACSPTSGFHHAEYYDGFGYCTFNGLALAALTLLETGTSRVAVLDLDEHFGNGTEDILRKLVIGNEVPHYTRGCPGYEVDGDPEDLLRTLPKLLDFWRHKRKVEIVLYQAGADPHVNDPVGTKYLTTEQMRVRDEIVFQMCRKLEIPVAWNLAGGYQTVQGKTGEARIRPVLDLHDNTMRECVRAFL